MWSRFLSAIGHLYRTTAPLNSLIVTQRRRLSCTRILNRTIKEIAVPPPIPAKIQDIILGFRASQCVIAASDLGIFDVLHNSDKPQKAEEVAAKIMANSEATEQLMDLLVALELLERSRNGESWFYTNTEMASNYLTKYSPHSMVSSLAFSKTVIYPLFGHLESAVREGSDQWMRALGVSSEELWKAVYQTDEAKLTFLEYMHKSSLHYCHAVSRAFDLSNFGSFCDVGGKSRTSPVIINFALLR